MKITFKHSIIPAIALAFAISTPASAQLLGGSGGGGLTGGLGGGLGGDMTGPITRTTGSVRDREKKVQGTCSTAQ